REKSVRAGDGPEIRHHGQVFLHRTMVVGRPAAVGEMQYEQDDRRFAFGANWTSFLKQVSDRRIAEAEKSLAAMLGEAASLQGKSVLDIGSGSGLFSLAAARLGAARIHSFDYDEQSVACTAEMKRRFAPPGCEWVVER